MVLGAMNLLRDIQFAGIKISVEGGRLKCKAKNKSTIDRFRADIEHNKEALITCLKRPHLIEVRDLLGIRIRDLAGRLKPWETERDEYRLICPLCRKNRLRLYLRPQTRLYELHCITGDVLISAKKTRELEALYRKLLMTWQPKFRRDTKKQSRLHLSCHLPRFFNERCAL